MKDKDITSRLSKIGVKLEPRNIRSNSNEKLGPQKKHCKECIDNHCTNVGKDHWAYCA